MVPKPPAPQVEDSPQLPDGVDDYDKEMESDPFAVSIYAHDIFKYYKEREVNVFIVFGVTLCNHLRKFVETQPIFWKGKYSKSKLLL